jgi:TatD DNase family protein
VTIQHLPPLDCHAHIAPDVTAHQLRDLGSVTVFAVTRTLDEAEAVSARTDRPLVWGCGVHPTAQGAIAAYDHERFRRLLQRFALVGEIGLDRRAGHLPEQTDVLRSILHAAHGEPVLLSLHSAGCSDEILALIAEQPHPGTILHWFMGDEAAVQQAVKLECYFSVNAGMTHDQLQRIPLDRMLPETDFPATARRGGGRRPGDVASLEHLVAGLTQRTPSVLRRQWYRNLRAVAMGSGAIERMPATLVTTLMSL